MGNRWDEICAIAAEARFEVYGQAAIYRSSPTGTDISCVAILKGQTREDGVRETTALIRMEELETAGETLTDGAGGWDSLAQLEIDGLVWHITGVDVLPCGLEARCTLRMAEPGVPEPAPDEDDT